MILEVTVTPNRGVKDQYTMYNLVLRGDTFTYFFG